IYNPASGQKRQQRSDDISRIAAVFHAAGVQVETCETTHAGSAVQQARDASADGFDTVIACGGDGTVNEALNGIMMAGGNAVLGLVPLGSGNLLASDLGLPPDPVAAARKILSYTPRDFRPGIVTSKRGSGPEKRYFVVAAGVGADAELMYRTAVRAKERWG